MARQRYQGPRRPTEGNRPTDWFGKGKEKDAYDAEKLYEQRRAKRDEVVRQRDNVLSSVGIKNARRDGPAQEIADFIVRPAATPIPTAAAVLGAGTLGAMGLEAYGNQAGEYLPTNPFAVGGRVLTNAGERLGMGGGAQAVGVDPLAQARNSVAQAADLVGTEAMLEALTVDQIKQMSDEKDVLTDSIEYEQISRVTRDMVDSRARELMQTPIQYSDGSVRPMRYDEAVRHATEQVNMELRANQVY